MEATKLREKLKEQFPEIIEDHRNLNYLEKIFGIIDERRIKLMAGETEE